MQLIVNKLLQTVVKCWLFELCIKSYFIYFYLKALTRLTQGDPFLHGLLAHSLTSVVQFTPVEPGGQTHWYVPTEGIQVAPRPHG